MTGSQGFTRRSLLFGAGALAGGGIGGVARGGVGRVPALLRPPGAGSEAEFLAACVRCGQCVSACPYDTLRFASSDCGLVSHGTPYLVAREVPCYLCRDHDALLCVDACPSGALSPVDDLAAIWMGTARIDESTCYAFNRVTCRACWHACPYPGDALAFDERLRPVIGSDACIGCGLCVYACLTEPTSISVDPRGEEVR